MTNEKAKKQELLFEKYGVFFAFNDELYSIGKNKVGGGRIATLGGGMYCKFENVLPFQTALKALEMESIKERQSNNTNEQIVKYELNNYESFYSGDISDVVGALRDYDGIDSAFVQKIFNKYVNDASNDCFG